MHTPACSRHIVHNHILIVVIALYILGVTRFPIIHTDCPVTVARLASAKHAEKHIETQTGDTPGY